MVKKLIFVLVTFLFLMQIVSAVDTEIKVKTLPNHEVQLTILESSASSLALESFKNNSDEYGDVSFIYSSDKSKFGLILFIKKDGTKIISKKYLESFVVGTPVYLELAPAWFEFIETPTANVSEFDNQTIENSTVEGNESEVLIESESQEVSEEAGSQITGAPIFGDNGFLTKKTISYTVGIIALLIGFFVIKTMRKKLKVPKEVKVKKLNKAIKQKKEKPKTNEEKRFNTNEEIIIDAEEKIKEAQEDIRKIKNEDKIKEAKKKIIEDQERLIRLRQGKE